MQIQTTQIKRKKSANWYAVFDLRISAERNLLKIASLL